MLLSRMAFSTDAFGNVANGQCKAAKTVLESSFSPQGKLATGLQCGLIGMCSGLFRAYSTTNFFVMLPIVSV